MSRRKNNGSDSAVAPVALGTGDDQAPSMMSGSSKARGVEAKPRGRVSKIAPFRDQMGVLSDAEVASLAGVTVAAVKMFRRRHHIDSEGRTLAPSMRSHAVRPKRRRSKLDPFLELLGVVADAEVAAMAGVTPANVRAFRRRHQIAAHDSGASPAPAVVSERPALESTRASQESGAPTISTAADRRMQAFEVRIEGNDSRFVVVGESLAQAAKAAEERLPDHSIISMEWLGPVL